MRLAGVGIPDPDGPVAAGQGQALAIRTESQVPALFAVEFETSSGSSRSRLACKFPQPHLPFLIQDSQQRPIESDHRLLDLTGDGDQSSFPGLTDLGRVVRENEDHLPAFRREQGPWRAGGVSPRSRLCGKPGLDQTGTALQCPGDAQTLDDLAPWLTHFQLEGLGQPDQGDRGITCLQLLHGVTHIETGQQLVVALGELLLTLQAGEDGLHPILVHLPQGASV